MKETNGERGKTLLGKVCVVILLTMLLIAATPGIVRGVRRDKTEKEIRNMRVKLVRATFTEYQALDLSNGLYYVHSEDPKILSSFQQIFHTNSIITLVPPKIAEIANCPEKTDILYLRDHCGFSNGQFVVVQTP